MIRQVLSLLAGSMAMVVGASASAVTPLEVWTDVDGTVYLHNTTALPLSFTGYGINSPDLDFDPAAWRSLSDWLTTDPSAASATLGGAAPGFQELVATSATISEENPVGLATLTPGARLSIGKPFQSPFAYQHASAHYTVPESSEHLYMYVFILSEPSTWLLATLAAVGCAVMRKRGFRVAANRSESR